MSSGIQMLTKRHIVQLITLGLKVQNKTKNTVFVANAPHIKGVQITVHLGGWSPNSKGVILGNQFLGIQTLKEYNKARRYLKALL